MNSRPTGHRVLGIDPGLTRMGFGVVEEARGRLTELAAGTIESSPGDPTAARLLFLLEQVRALVSRWEPDAVAVERIFLKVNAATAVPAIQAAGVALAAAAGCGAPVEEYSPLEVKMAVAGTGTAPKDQVRYMVERILGPRGGGRRPSPVPDGGQDGGQDGEQDGGGGAPVTRRTRPDTTDALAVAICHLHSRTIRALRAAGGATR